MTLRGSIEKVEEGNYILRAVHCPICDCSHTTQVEVVEQRFILDGFDYLCWAPCANFSDRVLLLRNVDSKSEEVQVRTHVVKDLLPAPGIPCNLGQPLPGEKAKRRA